MMPSNPLTSLRLTVPSRCRKAALLILCAAVAYGVLPTPMQAAGSWPKDASGVSTDGTICRFRAPLATPIDPCPFLEQAYGFIPRLSHSAADYARKVAEGFDPERSLRIQQALLREDLLWQSRGFSRRQMDLMVFVSVALSLQRTDAQLVELRRAFEQKGDAKDQQRIRRIDLYQSEALDLLEELSASLQSVPDSELRFHF